MNKKALILVLFVPFLFIGCGGPAKEELIYSKPLPPGQNALRKITRPHEIPDFLLACFDLTDLRHSIGNSLNYLQKPSSEQFYPCSGITHDRAVASLQKFAELLDSGLIGSPLNEAIRQQFDVYTSVGYDDKGSVLFTGYYTPVFDASMTRTERFKYPLYKTPEDLVKLSSGEILGRRMADGSIVQYPDRRQIEESGMLSGYELVWLSDPFDVYIAHVQGSVRLRLPDGSFINVGYDASNGLEYKSVPQELVNDGIISSDQIGLATMMDYFKRNPNKVAEYTRRNPRFVFFQQEDGPPRGSLNEPVTALRSVATDKSIFPRGCLTFISTDLPDLVNGTVTKHLYRGFALDQDTGGAIRAAGRCDIYFGQGDQAGRLAGQTYQHGRLYYLFLKSD